jgi:hypothetical protein
MAVQHTTLDGLHSTEDVSIEHTRATEREITFNHDFGAAANIAEAYLTIRDEDDTVVLQKTLAAHPDEWDLSWY